jgi:two-component system sensor histidine kinase BaeS
MSIQKKLFIAFLLTTVTLIGAMVLLFQWQLDRELFRYLNKRHEAMMNTVAAELAEHYAQYGNWNAFNSRQEWRQFLRTIQPENKPARPAQNPSVAPPPADAELRPIPILLLDADGNIVNRNLRRYEQDVLQAPVKIRIAIKQQDTVVGYLISLKRERLDSVIDQGFRDSQRRAIRFLGLLAVVLSAVIAFVVARHLTAPIRKLSKAAHQLTQQHFSIDVDIKRRDELGQLARDIQELALRLQQHSDARQRWFADISHELRTPLSVLQGEIEALLDGVRPLTPEHIQSLHQEVGHLLRLVADLYDLAQADLGTLNYQKQRIDLCDLVRDSVASFQPAFRKAGLQLDFHTSADNICCLGDNDRLRQLCNNLLHNSLRYTDAGGAVSVTLDQTAETIVLNISDSAPGVPDEALPRLFDHLYRVDSARTRSKGGSGLGLAICKRIAEAHQGTLSASHSERGGLRVSMQLPANDSGHYDDNKYAS